MRQEQRELIAELISEKKKYFLLLLTSQKTSLKSPSLNFGNRSSMLALQEGLSSKVWNTSVRVFGMESRSTMKKVSLGKQTGSGGVLLSKLDHTVLSILGENSAYLQGLNQDDDLPIMPSLHGSGPRLDDSLDLSTSASVDNLISGPSTLIHEANSAEDDKDNVSSDQKNRKRKGPISPLWCNKEYKSAKMKKVQADFEEQKNRIQLMEAKQKFYESQILVNEAKALKLNCEANEAKERSEFFKAARLSLTGDVTLEINDHSTNTVMKIGI